MSSTTASPDSPTTVEPIILNSEEAAKFLGVKDRRSVYTLVRERGLPHVALGPRLMGFRPDSLRRWAEEQERTTR